MIPHSDLLRRQEANPPWSSWQISTTTTHSHHGTFRSGKVNSSRYSFRLQVRVETNNKYAFNVSNSLLCVLLYDTKLNISVITSFSNMRLHDNIYLALLQCHHITPHKFWKTFPSSDTLKLTKNQRAIHVIRKHIWKMRQKFLKRLVNRIWPNLIKYN